VYNSKRVEIFETLGDLTDDAFYSGFWKVAVSLAQVIEKVITSHILKHNIEVVRVLE
jgi:hypothetical protein